MSRVHASQLALAAVTAGAWPLTVHAQRDSATKLEPLVVTVSRGSGTSVLGSPFAITVVEPDSARPGQRHASIDETLAMVPGLTSMSRNNPAQDPRLSIRGFGARSAFGVRGIRVLRDGMPITLPDGQTPLDYVSLESVGRIEILRGAASALYGNASGGVVDLQSRVPRATPLSVDARQWLGSSSSLRSVLAASGSRKGATYVSDIEYSRSDGARAHSAQRATSGYAHAKFRSGGSSLSFSLLALDNPLSQNPGALTGEEMSDDPQQADASSIRRDARKAVKQIQLGASAESRFGATVLAVSAYGGARSLDNPLTFGIIEIGRHSYGLSATARNGASLLGLSNAVAAGIELQSQNDLRRNYATCIDTVAQTSPTASCPDPGEDRGIVTLGQRELVSSFGAYVSDQVSIGERVSVSAGVRADHVAFEVRDRLTGASNPDDSGRRGLGAVSPVAGVVISVGSTQSVYANVSSAFETPTATELGNHADGSAGINPDLDPQRSTTLEGGAKGWVGIHLRYDAAVFDTRVRDELIPFEIPQSNGRRFFRNAGRTRRRGAEAGLEISGGPLLLTSAYTYSHFRFERYAAGDADYGGNEIPGIPAHRLQAALRAARGNAFGVVEIEAAGTTFVDDANTTRAPGYFVAGGRAGWVIDGGFTRFSVTAGVQNIFDRTYASSVAINAARGKYYEPAVPRTLFIGLSLGGHSR